MEHFLLLCEHIAGKMATVEHCPKSLPLVVDSMLILWPPSLANQPAHKLISLMFIHSIVYTRSDKSHISKCVA